MARMLKELPERRMWNAKYPWDEWFGSSHGWRLAAGVDFQPDLHTMENHIRAMARKRKIRCSVRRYHDKSTNKWFLDIFPLPGEPEKPKRKRKPKNG